MNLVYASKYGTLYQGDCMTLLRELESDAVEVVFADPPFNLGKNYGSGISDALPDHKYLDWCNQWIKEGCRVLKPGGAFWLYNLPKWNIELGHMLNEAHLDFRHWIAIDHKTSLPVPGRLYPSHYSLLYYTKGKSRTFHRPRIPIPTCRHCRGDIKDYGGHRKSLNPDGLNLSDVWTDIPPVRHAKTKHRGANALSEKLLERVLTISSQEGDLILDPFGGSGTTYAVAEHMNRRWLGVEKGDTDPIVARLTGVPKVDGIMPGLGSCRKGIRRQQGLTNPDTVD